MGSAIGLGMKIGEKVAPKLKSKEGVSAVVVHTRLGQCALDGIVPSLSFLEPARVEYIEQHNFLWHKSLPLSPLRKRFFCLLHKKRSLAEIYRKLQEKSIFERSVAYTMRLGRALKRRIKSLFRFCYKSE